MRILRNLKKFILKYQNFSNILYAWGNSRHSIMAKLTNWLFIDRFQNVSTQEFQPSFTITFGCRLVGNRDHSLENFLESFEGHTSKIRDFEILIKIDDDDYLGYFLKIQEVYKNINLKFFVSSRGNGYADMHLWHEMLTKKKSSTSKFHIILTDDVLFDFDSWDEDLRKRIDSRTPKNILLATPSTYDDTIALRGPNPTTPTPIYWVQGTDFPVINFSLIESVRNVIIARKLTGWTAYGNTFNIDSYFGDLLRLMPETVGRNCHLEIPLYFKRTGITSWSNDVWPGEAKKGQLRNSTLIFFREKGNSEVRSEFAKAIAED